jgi:ABC-type methionine transport system ATPase subunit
MHGDHGQDRGAKPRRATVLMVCHDMEVVQDFARRVLVVAGGR